MLRTLVSLAQSPNLVEAQRASSALFGIVAEGLADQFEPRLCDSYAAMFSEVLAWALADFESSQLRARYQRVRQPRRFSGRGDSIREIFVLSRVTLGADIAVTSLCLAAMKQRFPGARLHFVGPRKNYELFEGDREIAHAPLCYRRQGTLLERLSSFFELKALVDRAGVLVVDPDSRLTQLGLLPICAEENYFFFESRGYGGQGHENLSQLTGRWLEETFSVGRIQAFLAPAESLPPADITVSLGVGENPAKRIEDPFERRLLEHLAGKRRSILIDRGGSPEEAARVNRAIDGLPQIRAWSGAFAPFAGAVARSKLYVGYDSAGQHVAAASGTPLLTVFAGYPCQRMFERWQPHGPGPKRVLQVSNPDPAVTYEAAARAIDELL
ncbi:MAG: hypothetical protein NZV14_09935 [Bryobacteraceae bacterium]|nr:hypothetical protein [Bryobacteraceae bacterium]MDW8378471.1 hypothetical protein [Bryobacterales bacterium]